MQSLGSTHPVLLSFLAFRVAIEHLLYCTISQSLKDSIPFFLQFLSKASNFEDIFGLFDPLCPDDLIIWHPVDPSWCLYRILIIHHQIVCLHLSVSPLDFKKWLLAYTPISIPYFAIVVSQNWYVFLCLILPN